MAGLVRSRLPPAAREWLEAGVRQAAGVRGKEQALAFVLDRVEELLRVVVPTFVQHPLPVSPLGGRWVVGAAAAGAATVEEWEAVATFVSGGAAAPVTLPAVLAANLGAFVLEVYVATSVRARMLSEAGRPVDPARVAADVAAAVTGLSGRGDTRALAERVARHLLGRWFAGAVPVAGIAVDAHAAQATVRRIAELPLAGADDG
ncbi:MAG: hypothetical protein ACRDZQ_05590 [Acidimicrobiales bacterium]